MVQSNAYSSPPHSWIPNHRLKTLFSTHGWLNLWMQNLGILRVNGIFTGKKNPCVNGPMQFQLLKGQHYVIRNINFHIPSPTYPYSSTVIQKRGGRKEEKNNGSKMEKVRCNGPCSKYELKAPHVCAQGSEGKFCAHGHHECTLHGHSPTCPDSKTIALHHPTHLLVEYLVCARTTLFFF